MLHVLASIGLAQESAREPSAESSRAGEARALFERGVQQTELQNWQAAGKLFERSRVLNERPATVFNLVLVYDKLGEPLRVVPMVQRLLQISDPVKHESERKEALAVEARAYAQLSRVSLLLEPASANVFVEDPGFVLANPRLLLLAPGAHVLTLSARGHESARRELQSERGEALTLRVSLQPAPELPAPGPSTRLVAPDEQTASRTPPRTSTSPTITSPTRRRVGRALALLGVAAWVAAASSEAVALSKAHELSSVDIEQTGLSAGERYQRVQWAVGPLAAAGAVSMIAGLLTARRPDRPRRRGLGIATSVVSVLVAGAGVALLSLDPGQVGNSALQNPRREAGMLLVAAGLPGLTWGIGEWRR